MIVKVLEIRDAGKFIPVLAIDMNPHPRSRWPLPDAYQSKTAQRFLLQSGGYPCDGRPNILITCIAASPRNKPDADGALRIASEYITERWADLKDGDVVDVEFISGISNQSKISARFA